MKMKKNLETRVKVSIPNLVSLVLLVLLTGCFLPGSRAYQPLPLWEAKFSAQASKNIFPQDVLRNPPAYAKTLVVWTGIIRQIQIDQEGEDKVHRFTIEHRYFDWIEDHGIQKERYFLSPRGEGSFALAWGNSSSGDDRFLQQFAVGDMIVAYGYPTAIRGNLVGFYPVQNIRSIKPEWYRTDVLDYGRPGEGVNSLKTPY